MLAFLTGLQLHYGLTDQGILSALRAAHVAADEYYTVRHALAWNTDFVIPVEAIEADSTLFQSCGRDFAAMCRHKQQLLAHNRLSVERIISILGPTGQRIPGVTMQHIAGIYGKWHKAVGITWLQTRIYQCSSITR